MSSGDGGAYPGVYPGVGGGVVVVMRNGGVDCERALVVRPVLCMVFMGVYAMMFWMFLRRRIPVSVRTSVAAEAARNLP